MSPDRTNGTVNDIFRVSCDVTFAVLVAVKASSEEEAESMVLGMSGSAIHKLISTDQEPIIEVDGCEPDPDAPRHGQFRVAPFRALVDAVRAAGRDKRAIANRRVPHWPRR